MRTKFLTFLTSVAIVFLCTATGYATAREPTGVKPNDSSVKKTDVVTPAIPNTVDKTELSVENETTFETTLATTAAPTSVSKWLEKRANEEAHSKPAFVQDMEAVGGGWCDACGCWMRHGCDPNGNCGIGHLSVCGSGYCSLHPYSPCTNTGG